MAGAGGREMREGAAAEDPAPGWWCWARMLDEEEGGETRATRVDRSRTARSGNGHVVWTAAIRPRGYPAVSVASRIVFFLTENVLSFALEKRKMFTPS